MTPSRPQDTALTPAQERFLEVIEREGEAWYVPAQSKMVKQLATLGLLTIAGNTRYSALRGSWERKATK